MNQGFHNIKVKDKIKETEDAYSFIFEITEDLASDFRYKSGQYITLSFDINGSEERRSYSLFTAPNESKFGVTVKLVPGGKVSTHMIKNLSVGDEVKMMAPEGRFLLLPDETKTRDHYFIAAGSGITPIMSMMRTVLEEEPRSTVNLIYGNKTEDTIIFKSQIDDFEANYKGQFNVLHTLSQNKSSGLMGGLKGMFGKKETSGYAKGRIDGMKIRKFLADHPTQSSEEHFYICGPGAMIELASETLKQMGKDSAQIHKEYFTVPEEPKTETEQKPAAASTGNAGEVMVKLTLEGKTLEASIDGSKTVLEGLIDKGITPPYSCTSGACATCIAKMTEGEAEMDVCFSLEDDEVASGLILTCQARVKSQSVTLDFDVT